MAQKTYLELQIDAYYDFIESVNPGFEEASEYNNHDVENIELADTTFVSDPSDIFVPNFEDEEAATALTLLEADLDNYGAQCNPLCDLKRWPEFTAFQRMVEQYNLLYDEQKYDARDYRPIWFRPSKRLRGEGLSSFEHNSHLCLLICWAYWLEPFVCEFYEDVFHACTGLGYYVPPQEFIESNIKNVTYEETSIMKDLEHCYKTKYRFDKGRFMLTEQNLTLFLSAIKYLNETQNPNTSWSALIFARENAFVQPVETNTQMIKMFCYNWCAAVCNRKPMWFQTWLQIHVHVFKTFPFNMIKAHAASIPPNTADIAGEIKKYVLTQRFHILQISNEDARLWFVYISLRGTLKSDDLLVLYVAITKILLDTEVTQKFAIFCTNWVQQNFLTFQKNFA